MQIAAKRIVVVGVSAAGKSTFSRKLAERMKLPLIHMDSIAWQPGWVQVHAEEAARQVELLTEAPEWILEGYIPKSARTIVFERADVILYLDYPRIVAATRYIKRWRLHRKNPRPELEGSPEKFDWEFLKLVWRKDEATSLDKFLQAVAAQNKILIFKRPKAAENFLTER